MSHKRCTKHAIGLGQIVYDMAGYTYIVYQVSICLGLLLKDIEFRTRCGVLTIVQTHECHEGEESQ